MMICSAVVDQLRVVALHRVAVAAQQPAVRVGRVHRGLRAWRLITPTRPQRDGRQASGLAGGVDLLAALREPVRSGLGVGFQARLGRTQSLEPPVTVGKPRRHRRVIRRTRVFGGVDRVRLGQHLVNHLVQLGQRPIAVGPRVRADLRPVQRDRAQAHQPGLGAQPQRVDEQRRKRLRVPRPEPCQRHMIRAQPTGQHPQRHILPATPLDQPRGPQPMCSRRRATPRPASPGHTPAGHAHRPDTRHGTATDPADRPRRSRTTPDDPPAANPAYPAATKTPAHDPRQ